MHDELVDAGVGQGNVCGPCASTVGDDFVEDGEVFAPVHVVSAVAQCREDLRAFNRDARARCRINGADDEVEGCFFRVVNDGAYIVNNFVQDYLKEKGIRVYDTMVGNYMTSIEMAGFSLTLLRLDDEMKKLYDAKADTLAWKK